ncbi:TetR family transcriptional regulator [Niabella ginsenosidivorans]|uniref:TetR family transcriptional regulator n=1 Tax=Niabella ginsenosidivorans TaxID=1176587 RepID=A0A1A9I697_9BACT|nr:TetR/AcrR family transcriptional regulator [Niabella ginsenosidivorans]ANH83198.1 TetR family transcriptional regulator [Niabella ginsenosidivorans]
MPKAKHTQKLDVTTEEKIKAAARAVFHKKGFAATRTRDIAEEAGINLALLNYYFRSKEKLFNIIMTETLSGFVLSMTGVLNDETTELDKKVELIASSYIDLISKEPEIPVFIVSEIRNNPNSLLEKLPVQPLVHHSVFVKQHQTAVAAGKITEPNPLHFLMNLMGLIVFPFVGKPLIQGIFGLKNAQFNQLMQERKKRIPIWIKAMMKAK